jgi:hypothetical protein
LKGERVHLEWYISAHSFSRRAAGGSY